jgi:hypothetical protein
VEVDVVWSLSALSAQWASGFFVTPISSLPWDTTEFLGGLLVRLILLR